MSDMNTSKEIALDIVFGGIGKFGKSVFSPAEAALLEVFKNGRKNGGSGRQIGRSHSTGHCYWR